MKQNDPFQIDERTWWSSRKSGLPKLPPNKDPDTYVAVWQDKHPSPEFDSYKVWYTGYRLSLASYFKRAYSGCLSDLLPQYLNLLRKE